MAPPLAPFWFNQRQGKMEAAGPDRYRLTAPNAPEAWISLRPTDDGRWLPVLRVGADGPEVSDEQYIAANVPDAWEAAFELYRIYVVV